MQRFPADFPKKASGYAEQRAAALGDSRDQVLSTILDLSSPEQWGDMLRAPLEQAAAKANEELVYRLLQAGANAGGTSEHRRCTLVNAAVDGGSARVLSALLRKGAKGEINTPSWAKGSTPLYRAVAQGKEDVTKVPILAGASVNTSYDNDSPLHCSIRRGSVQTARALLLAGALPTSKLAGAYPINLAAGLGQDEVVQDLIHKGSGVNYVDDTGDTPLVRAVRGGHVSTMRLLLSAGADVRAGMANGCNALHLAAELGQAGAIEALLQAGMRIGDRTQGGRTALYQAVSFGRLDILLRLLELGASVHVADDSGLTPLHRAAFLGDLGATDMLLRWNADETRVDNFGYVPARWIEKGGDAEERLSTMLARAPHDRAWRRRGFLAMCRARHGRLHPPTRQSRSIRARTERGAAAGLAATGTTAARTGSSGAPSGQDGDSASGLRWLVEHVDDEVFRHVVGFV